MNMIEYYCLLWFFVILLSGPYHLCSITKACPLSNIDPWLQSITFMFSPSNYYRCRLLSEMTKLHTFRVSRQYGRHEDGTGFTMPLESCKPSISTKCDAGVNQWLIDLVDSTLIILRMIHPCNLQYFVNQLQSILFTKYQLN
jgi:hypothetical protein